MHRIQQRLKKIHCSLSSYSTISELGAQLDDIFNDNSFRNANWGVVIQSLENGEYFYKRNEDKFFVPASNLKLFTTAAGLIITWELIIDFLPIFFLMVINQVQHFMVILLFRAEVIQLSPADFIIMILIMFLIPG